MEKKAVLVGIFPQGKEEECLKSLNELERLADTAGAITFAKLTQMKNIPDAATCIGKGKLEELRELCQNNDISNIIFDCELSPAQIKNIENETECDVVDRSMLILDIFALHAVSAEGKIQVELAQLKYTAPRLIGKGKDMSRLGGGIGTRGPGESKLEIDRRRLASRISFLQNELLELEKNRQIMRAQRERSTIPKACIVGYTNAGKSSLLNMLTDAGILAQDKLFATLDPTTRKFELPSGISMLLTDTVGFIRKLPHHLIHAFKSTLEEAVYCDFLINVVDASDEECYDHMKTTDEILNSLGVTNKPILYIFNKSDLCSNERIYDLRFFNAGRGRVVNISVKEKTGYDELVSQLESLCRYGKTREHFLFPYTKQSELNQFYQYAEIINSDYTDNGTRIYAWVDEKAKNKFSMFLD
ncbi:MAG: GTPase HflX [Clostridia bacterium]|nr:GTPase HflX [Clostridia bacterium]